LNVRLSGVGDNHIAIVDTSETDNHPRRPIHNY
jgi:hypothetical protein